MRMLTRWLTLLAFTTPLLADSEHDRIDLLMSELAGASTLGDQAAVLRIVETLTSSRQLVTRVLDQLDEDLNQREDQQFLRRQDRAIAVIGLLAKPSQRVAERLDQWLRSKDLEFVIPALVAVRAYDVPFGAELLAKLTRDARPEVRRRAREAYKASLKRGRRLPYVFLLASHEPDEIALGCLAASVSAKTAPQELVEALEHEDRQVYEAAYRAIVEMGDASPAATAPIVKHLNHEDSSRRRRARAALLTLRTSLEDVRQCYEAELRTGGGRRRARALNGLAWIGPPARDSLPTIRAILKDKEQRGFWSRAAWALCCISGDSQDALKPLALCLDPLDTWALVTITRLGEEAKSLSPLLRGFIEGSNPAHAEHAMVAVGATGHADPKTITALNEVMREHPSERKRVIAGVVLAKLGHVTRESRACVARRAQSSVGSLHAIWAVTLAHSLGDLDRNEAQQRLIRLGGENETAVVAVLKALGHVGDEQAWHYIERVAKDTRSYWVRRTAEESLRGQK